MPKRPRHDTAKGYPPSWSSVSQISALRAPPRFVDIPAAIGGGTHPRLVTRLQVSEALRRAALAADADPSGNIQRHLWENLDPPMLQRSPPAKAFVQDLYTTMMMVGPVLCHSVPPMELPCLSDRAPLFEDDACLRHSPVLGESALMASSGTLRLRWYWHLRYAAELMARIFEASCAGWDRGLDPATREVVVDATTGRPTVPRDDWFPFETYNSLELAVGAMLRSGNLSPDDRRCAEECLKDRATRFRSRLKAPARVRITRQTCRSGPAPEWDVDDPLNELLTHLSLMLEIEAKVDIFKGAAPTLVGGMFLLTTLADNWPRESGHYDFAYWHLRMIHFAIERNTRLRANAFALGALDDEGSRPPPASMSNTVRSYCWLFNAPLTMLALKATTLLRVRVHAYDRAEGRAPTTSEEFAKLVAADRHDIEQAKLHWLPPQRARAAPAERRAANGAVGGRRGNSCCDATEWDNQYGNLCALIAETGFRVLRPTTAEPRASPDRLFAFSKRFLERKTALDLLRVEHINEVDGRVAGAKRELMELRSKLADAVDEKQRRALLARVARLIKGHAPSRAAPSQRADDYRKICSGIRDMEVRIESMRRETCTNVLGELWKPAWERVPIDSTPEEFQAAREYDSEVAAAFGVFVETAIRNIVHAVRRCSQMVASLLLVHRLASERLPDRLVNASVTGALEALAETIEHCTHDFLRGLPPGVPITAAHATLRWRATRKLAAIALLVEPWLRSPRLEHCVNLKYVRGQFALWTAEQQGLPWKTWPPSVDDVADGGVVAIAAMLRWGGGAGADALMTLVPSGEPRRRARAGLSLPPVPYAERRGFA